MARARAIEALYAGLAPNTTAALDLSDLLRAEVVLAVSVFDHFVHEIVRVGMLDAFGGRRPSSVAFGKFKVPMAVVNGLLAASGDIGVLDQEIRLQHGYRSFQAPEQVADAVKLITDAGFWKSIAKAMRMPHTTVKERLGAIVDRRNKIAHEADLDPTDPTRQARWPISLPDVAKAVEFLEKTGVAIAAVVAVDTP